MAAGALTDTHGNPMLAYSTSYTLDIGTVPFPTPLITQLPQGALVYSSSASSTISASDSDSFTLSLDAGQTLTIAVNPAATLRPSLELRDPLGNLIGSTIALAAGKNAVLQAIGIPTAGTYTITV